MLAIHLIGAEVNQFGSRLTEKIVRVKGKCLHVAAVAPLIKKCGEGVRSVTSNEELVYATDDELKQLKDNGIAWDEQITVDQFRITRLQIKFLNPNTREDKLNKMHLVHLD